MGIERLKYDRSSGSHREAASRSAYGAIIYDPCSIVLTKVPEIIPYYRFVHPNFTNISFTNSANP